VLGLTRDITERKRAEKNLRETEQRLQLVVDNSPIILFTLDQNGIFTLSEGKGLATLGLQPGQVTGLSAYDLYSQLPEVAANIRRALAGEPVSFVARSGPLAFDTHYIPYRHADGTIVGVIGSAFDISAQIQSAELLQVKLQENEVLLKEIHHRVKNNLQVISSLLYLQSRKAKTPDLQTMFLESQNRIVSMALIHEKLYQSSDLVRITFADYAYELAHFLFQSFGVDQSQVALSVEANDLALDVDNAVPCGLIINEIISNSLKYAFPNGRKGSLRIKLDLEPADRFNLTLSDDGIGLPADFEMRSATTLGTKLIERLTEQIQGTIEYSSSSQGTRYVISFPHEE
jgi:PAS domain S-box-containing protein